MDGTSACSLSIPSIWCLQFSFPSYIGLFAWRYGFVPPVGHDNPNQQSITELEYRKAVQAGKPRFIFLLAEDAPWSPAWMDSHTGDNERGRRVATLRRELGLENTIDFFHTPDRLARLVSVSVGNWVRSQTIHNNLVQGARG